MSTFPPAEPEGIRQHNDEQEHRQNVVHQPRMPIRVALMTSTPSNMMASVRMMFPA